MDREEIRVRGEELVKKVKELIHQGNIRRIIIKNEQGETFLEIPLTFGVVGAVLAPMWAALGALAAGAAQFRVELVKKESGSSTAEDAAGNAEDRTGSSGQSGPTAGGSAAP